VESYTRTSKSATEEASAPKENEIRTSHSKVQVYVEQGLKKIQQMPMIIITGKGAHVNKAVSVAEIIKRQMQGTLHQYTQIGSVSVVEQWDAEALDSIKVDKKVPVIIIHLATEEHKELEATSGYQAPTGPDE
jgi:DNA-binding protein